MSEESDKQSINLLIGKMDGKLDMVIETMNQLSASFANLEKGRLSTLEINFAKLLTEVNQRTDSGIQRAKATAVWFSLVIGGIISVLGGIITVLILKYGFGI